MKQYFDYCFKYGKNAEKRFVEKYLTNINYPTKNQDIYEHWDVEGTLKSINNNKYKCFNLVL